MVGKQRTFELIPTSLVVSNGPKPPMTSKQAKKAHQLATRGPKISRAEQRRLDAEELARQKKEYEREKASARAKAAREKKAAKEQADREARKKMGLPEPSRFVRASQPTIFRFVEKGNKRTSLEMEIVAEESDATVCDDEEYDEQPEYPAKKVKAGGESEDEYGGFPSFSQSELGVVLEKLDSSVPPESKQETRSGSGPSATPKAQSEARPAELLPAKKSSDEFPWESSQNLDDMVATQLLSEVADAAARSAQQQKFSAQPDLIHTVPVTTGNAPRLISKSKSPHLSPIPVTNTRAALQQRSVNMAPPPRPVHAKGKRDIWFAPSPPKPRTLTRLPQLVSEAILPPSATQVFLEDHLDDFFPSPSQETRELLDDLDDLPSNTQIARELQPDVHVSKAPEEDIFADLICTQDFILSSQDILEITTPCPPPSKSRLVDQHKSTPTPLPPRTAPQKPKRRFFEEKEEDLLYAAIHESKLLAAQQEKRDLERRSSQWMQEKIIVAKADEKGREREMSGSTKRSFQRTASNVTDYGEGEFHDCEEELLALC
jgi:hypothetical protein